MYCRKCGIKNHDTAKFCVRCGTPLKPKPENGIPDKRTEMIPAPGTRKPTSREDKRTKKEKIYKLIKEKKFSEIFEDERLKKAITQYGPKKLTKGQKILIYIDAFCEGIFIGFIAGLIISLLFALFLGPFGLIWLPIAIAYATYKCLADAELNYKFKIGYNQLKREIEEEEYGL
ncbi:MAG TPA: zinc-ribbon domain-containing protein [Methanothermobacter sp.]|uniref:Zinc-ribbon domain-containing protein n=1 Tax=Methanothermobacter tenebrarum TaxID=680118 RepID=A0ABM7YF00_9EURY|nr:zinc ribbon domain-containing protein [Methanothermobacter tenebrarum]BDH79947.1 hypothetical protein MTTB_13260 [Methanothermobacter tenebrarum]HHW16496.1 zinc-ribbon domain-containing protein [Methanothermobacter sp.]HOQ20286.1 zinc ribbon domain-containing protein [Methanothermobacter sp.]